MVQCCAARIFAPFRVNSADRRANCLAERLRSDHNIVSVSPRVRTGPAGVSQIMKLIDRMHETRIKKARRAEILSRELAALMPQNGRVLDVGCGDGLVARNIREIRGDVRIQGVDVLIQPAPHVPVRQFELGLHLPADDKSFDTVMFVDVLHHTESTRVRCWPSAASKLQYDRDQRPSGEGFMANSTLRLMDHVETSDLEFACLATIGGVSSGGTNSEQSDSKWRHGKREAGTSTPCFSLFFDRSLHFIARLRTS